MVLDLSYLCQRMQPPVEKHPKCASACLPFDVTEGSLCLHDMLSGAGPGKQCVHEFGVERAVDAGTIRLWTTEEGRFGVQKVPCARTYHINVLLSVKSLARGADERAMVLQRCAPAPCCDSRYLPCLVPMELSEALKGFSKAAQSPRRWLMYISIHAKVR
jgi:hypothetical protein